MIVASHDRYLVERVADSVYGMLGDGRLTHLPGGVDEYLSRVSALAPPPPGAPGPSPVAPASTAAQLRTAKKELARLERQVDKLAEREARLHEQLAVHATDYQKVTALDAELRAVQAEKQEAEQAWLALADRVGEG
jgi:septal ring factor EnvC (AmiA/AmiB activator)